jgi:hypothetical protein
MSRLVPAGGFIRQVRLSRVGSPDKTLQVAVYALWLEVRVRELTEAIERALGSFPENRYLHELLEPVLNSEEQGGIY